MIAAPNHPESEPRALRTVDGTAYWEYGDPEGYPIVLVHGFRGDHHGLEGIAMHLASYRVIVPDLPGFGETPRRPSPHTLKEFASWLTGFVPQLVQGSWALVGHSFGSLVVARAVADGLSPDQIVLINPISAPALEGPRGVLTRLAVAYYRAGAQLPERLANRILRDPLIVRFMSEAMAKTRDRALRARIHGQHAQYFSTYTDRQSLLEAFQASVSETVHAYAPSFDMPTLIIAGEVDDITPLTEQLRLARTTPSSEFHVVKGSGHLVHYEATAACASRIDAFLRGVRRQ